ncbi:hypothetical protein M6G65_31865 [Methylobacterium tardum]|uniref:hypothetical protein n=1 Tax=Methylobacterium tardum TaxID=374432 RepID=UPI0020218CC5|nr:hypothetical protein [Methylobacterium tardum]URD36849.1 hypothetical protein M6G65_31865 [Methylobacterium tardum]
MRGRHGHHGSRRGPALRAAEQAFDFSSQLLQEAVLGYDGVSDRDWLNDHLAADGGTFSVPSCVGMVCRQCRCSHNDPCEEGCGWLADGLRTACAAPEPDAGVEAAAPLQPGDVVVNGVVRHEPKLPEEEARAVVKGACRAVGASELAEVQPMRSDLRRLAAAIDGMHAEIEEEAP